MKREKVSDGTKPDAIDSISNGPADDEPQAQRRQTARKLREPNRERYHRTERHRDKYPAASIAILLQKPIGDAAIPRHHHIEKRRKHDLLHRARLEHPDRPGLEKLVRAPRGQRHTRAKSAIPAPELHKIPRYPSTVNASTARRKFVPVCRWLASELPAGKPHEFLTAAGNLIAPEVLEEGSNIGENFRRGLLASLSQAEPLHKMRSSRDSFPGCGYKQRQREIGKHSQRLGKRRCKLSFV